ncbi:MAG TPA: hypothetical protein VEO00_13125 [Actinomycetota bacterium]|nr:hypothetical protein [Actinomycetota bacterium]
MAIKGKSRSRGGRVGNAPRPVIVIKKMPFLQRRSTRMGALLLVLGVIGATLWIGFAKQRVNEDRARQGESVSRINSQVQNNLQGISQPLPPSNLSILPDLAGNLEQFKSGDLSAKKVRDATRLIPKTMQGAAETIGGIEVPDELRNHDYTADLLDALFLMSQGLKAYGNVAASMLLATNLDGDARADLLDSATDALADGQKLFDHGYQKLTNIRTELGVYSPTSLGAQ